MKNYVYIDYENINNLEALEMIEGRYFFFIGENQKKINSDLVFSTNGFDVEWIKIKGSGKNALDFHIVYYLAKMDSEKNTEHLILSKDTGFDPLIAHLKNKDINIRRIITLADIKNKNKTAKLDSYDIVHKNLSKIAKTKRPKSMNKLKSHIKTLMKDFTEEDIQKIIEELFRSKFISSGDNSRLKYMN